MLTIRGSRTDSLAPGVRYLGNIHGNELASCHSLLRLAQQLLAGYPQDASVKELIDESVIYILPTLNPGKDWISLVSRQIAEALMDAA